MNEAKAVQGVSTNNLFARYIDNLHRIEMVAVLPLYPIPPIRVYERPFAVDPVSGLMQLDGLFDVTRGKQLIGIYYTPTIDLPNDIQGYYYVLELPTGSGIQITWSPPAHTLLIYAGKPSTQRLFRGRPVLRFIEADFSNAKPGKYGLKLQAFEIPLSGIGPKRRPEWDLERDIYVIKTSGDYTTNNYVAECPEGKLLFHAEKVGVYPWMDWNKWITPPTTAKFESCKPPLVLPVAFTLEMLPAKPFAGQLGPIPFEDPWWKVLAGILAAVLAILGAIFGKRAYDGGANWQCTQGQGVGGYQKSCSLEGPEEAISYGAGAALSGILSGIATKILLSDEKDPFRIGEENTKPGPGELTTRESLHVEVDYLTFPNIAGPLDAQVSWEFTRITDANLTYTFRQQWKIHSDAIRMNSNLDLGLHKYPLNSSIELSATFESNNKPLLGSDVYVSGFLSGPMNQVRPVSLTDEVLPGKYQTSETFMSSDDIGEWDLYLFAQSVDQSHEFTPPVQAAGSIGGSILNQVLRLKPTKKNCVVEIVKAGTFEIIPPQVVID